MSTTTPPNPPEERSEDKLAQLLAKAGPRSKPSAALETEVRAAVHAEWLHLTQGRKVRQRRRWLSAAALLLVVIGAGWLTLNSGDKVSPATLPLIATVTQINGTAVMNGAALLAHDIHGGDLLRSGVDGGLRVELQSGISMRMDRNTEVRWTDAGLVQLVQGAIYIDSHNNAAALTVHTAQGDVTHLGTRYLVDADARQLRVAVREGRVGIRTGVADLTVDALQQVQLLDGSVAQRSDLNMSDAIWQWADEMAQAFALENRSVAEFLEWVSRETGYELRYTSNEVQRAAASTLLHGGQTSQAPLQALQAVLAATDFRVNVQDRHLLITQAQ